MILRLLLLSLVFLAACSNSQKQANEADNRSLSHAQTIEEILEISGMTDEMQRTPPAVHQHFQPIVGPFKPATQDLFIRIVDEVFNARILYFDLRDYWVVNAPPEKARALHEWLHSDMAREMRRLSSLASENDAQSAIGKFMESYKTDSLVQSRLPLYRRLEGGTGKSTTDLLISITGPAMKVLNEYREAEGKLSAEQIQQRVDMMQQRMEQYFTQSAEFFFAFSYRNVGEGDLQKYVAFYESGIGKWYREFSRAAFDTVFNRAGKSFTQKVHDYFVTMPNPAGLHPTRQVDSLMKALDRPILGLVHVGFQGEDWYGFTRSRFDSSGKLLLIAQNGEAHPDEFIDINVDYKGPGKYGLESSQGLFYKMERGQIIGDHQEAITGEHSTLQIDSYDERSRIMRGSFELKAASQADTTHCVCRQFAIRIRE